MWDREYFKREAGMVQWGCVLMQGWILVSHQGLGAPAVLGFVVAAANRRGPCGRLRECRRRPEVG